MARVIICDKTKEMIGISMDGDIVEGDGHCGKCDDKDRASKPKPPREGA